MTSRDIVQQRLLNQRLAGPAFENPAEVVRWLGAVQAQEYPGAKWALAQRTTCAGDAAIDKAFANGAILRTHVMRPTWHFVAPEDIRWLHKLTAPRVHAVNANLYRRLGLDDALFARSHAVLTRVLRGGKQRTRPELASLLKKAGITTERDNGLRLAYILMHAELDGLICSGALRGKQHTYALLAERVPEAKTLTRDESLARLVCRYFTSRGPATLKDFAWWSGLSQADARAGLHMLKPEFEEVVVDGSAYWFAPHTTKIKKVAPRAHLLPAYDEYTAAYKNHGAILDPQHRQRVVDGRGIVIIVDGRIVGTWQRVVKKDSVVLTLRPFSALTRAQDQAVAEAVQRYGAFLDLPVVLD